MVEMLITNKNKTFMPILCEGVEWSTERKSVSGKLTFRVIEDSKSRFEEGAAVRFRVDGKNVFFGFVFSKKADKNGIVSVTAYDQLRYLKNKDTYVYENKTASQLVKMLAADFQLNIGKIEDTKFVIASRIEENTSLFDMIENALDLTLENTGEMYVLFDDFGRLTLKNLSSMYVKNSSRYLCINEESAENFDCSSSIDSDTYNKIKLSYDNNKTCNREIYIKQDSENINRWGVLQYFGKLSKDENGQAKAEQLLKLYNVKSRALKINKAIGDTRVRAGSLVMVDMNFGDTAVKNFMLVDKATHTFKLDEHYMNLTLKGGEFNG